MKKIVFVLYQVIRSTRYSVLQSVFGYVSHCPQAPTCGTFFIQEVENNGIIVGGYRGIKRALFCSSKSVVNA